MLLLNFCPISSLYSVLILTLGHVRVKHETTISSSLPYGNEKVAVFVIRPQTDVRTRLDNSLDKSIKSLISADQFVTPLYSHFNGGTRVPVVPWCRTCIIRVGVPRCHLFVLPK